MRHAAEPRTSIRAAVRHSPSHIDRVEFTGNYHRDLEVERPTVAKLSIITLVERDISHVRLEVLQQERLRDSKVGRQGIIFNQRLRLRKLLEWYTQN